MKKETLKKLGGPIIMLKILLGDIVADMRGKSGGMVYQNGRYGLIKRVKVTPVNPQSTLQQTQRGTFSAISSLWRGLTQAERNTWLTGSGAFPYSDIFGKRQTLSGNSLFVKLNTVLSNLGSAVVNSLPTPVAVALATIVSAVSTSGANTISLVFTPTPVPTGFKLVIEATPQVSPGIEFVKNQYRIVERLNAAGTSPYAFGTAYAAQFGSLVSGQKIGIRIYLASKTTGQVGIATALTTIVI